MKIALFSDTFFPHVNGVANVAYQSAQAMIERGHDVIVFTAGSHTDRSAVKDLRGLKTVFLPSIPLFFYPDQRAALPFSFSSWRQLRKFQPDIIHTHTPFGVGFAAVIYSRLTHTPLLGTNHTFFDDYLKHIKLDFHWMKKFSWSFLSWYYHFCSLLISPSHALEQEMLGHGFHGSMAILPNSVNIDAYVPASSDERRYLKRQYDIPGKSIAYMGRLSYEKGVDRVIRAFAQAHPKIQSTQLFIIGDGPERKHLEILAQQLHLEHHVVFTGYQHDLDLIHILQAQDVFVTASASENMPLSVLEAMAIGLPVIAVRERGMAEIVTHGQNGLLASHGDNAALAGHMMSMINDDALRVRLGEVSRRSAEQYSHIRMGDALERLYQGIQRI